MKFKSALLLIPLFSAAAQAGYVDYRHEYYDDGRNYDRVYMFHRFATGFGVAVEAISRSEDTQSNDAWNNMESNGNEYTASYQFTWRDLIWQPGIAIETGDNITIYKPYIRVQYNINDSWWTAFRYRQEYMRRNTDGKDDRMVYRPEAWLGYNVNDWMFELNGIYKIADSEDLYNNRKDDYEYNFRVAYKLGSWVPFVEVGNVSSGYNTTTTDDRQTRYRVGLGYNF
ncbi:oligogalacturonate-specific porin KdgM family protein [Citrobacter freundii]|uniref:oligogalacturonate-specific porin KdgM family protein n=1 Tax=Citrobacter freundii TaxID=546 RepID=UPI0035A83110